MRIIFQTEGGVAYFPGLAKPVEIDIDALPQAQADALQGAITDAAFFELPAHVNVPQRGAADVHTYTITVEANTRRHTVRVSDPPPEKLGPLIKQLRAAAKTMRAVERANRRKGDP